MVFGVAYSPDGRRLASGGEDGTVKVWDAGTGEILLNLKEHTWWICGVAFSPDGRHLASASRDQTVKIWDAVTGQNLFTLTGHTMRVCAVAYSPDGRRLASACEDGARMWDPATGRHLFTLRGHTGGIFGVAFSPDNRRLATAGEDRTVKIWDADTGQELLSLKGHTSDVMSVAFSPDGLHLASASTDQTVRVWDTTPLTPQRLIKREAQGLVQFLLAKPLTPDEAAAAIRRDPTITEAVREQALAWVEPYWRSRIHSEAVHIIVPLFAELMLRSQVVTAIRANGSLNEAVRQEALALAETFPENAPLLNVTSWAVVREPGADAAAYQRALRQAQAACRAAPDIAGFINTLGVAYYRLGQYAEAIAALEKSRSQEEPSGSDAGDLYFLAMCHYRLGNATKAREYLERAKDSQQRNAARMPDAQLELERFRSEAEALLAKPAGK
jgi:hypothetical protein